MSHTVKSVGDMAVYKLCKWWVLNPVSFSCGLKASPTNHRNRSGVLKKVYIVSAKVMRLYLFVSYSKKSSASLKLRIISATWDHLDTTL